MSNFSLNNLAITATNSAMTAAMGRLFDTLQTKIANGGRDNNCKFYYSGPGAGGSILQVATKGIVGGAVSALKDEAVNAFNSLLNGKKKTDEVKDGQEWFDQVYEKNRVDNALYGYFPVDNDHGVFALDDWGCRSTEALMLGIEVDKEVRILQEYYTYSTFQDGKSKKYYAQNGKLQRNGPFASKYLVWYDTTALITIDSDKNMVISRVQGRDYSRKELISNGDIKFSVSGQITSGKPDVYPTEEVKKFIKVMQYKGIIKVTNQILHQFGISHIIVTDFHLSAKEGYKSVQNYTFNAIGLQPAYEIEVVDDTVKIIEQKSMNYDTTPDTGWETMIKNQLAGLKSMAGDLVSQSAALASGMLDSKL